ncbi:MAG: 2-phosphosulfolactate phosphatase, partial [Actinomycetota bacterium]
LEVLLGAGAVIAALVEARIDGPSPEARAAVAAHAAMAHDLGATLADCVSGRELIVRHYDDDVRLAAQADVSTTVPVLDDGAFRAGAGASASSRWR